jgi:ComF family protein
VFDVDALLEAILPARCALCAGPGIGERICPGCRADLPWLMGHCPGCGIALTPGQASCGRCASPRRAAARVFAPLAYAYPVDRLVTGAKFHRRLQDARLLGLLLADALAGAMASGRLEPVDLILPVPLHRRRLGARGYNQALEIARPLAARLALPLDPDACARVRPTREQAGLPAAERRRNLRAAFIARTPVRGLRVAIVDDVITTGSTVAALAQALRRAGAAQVQAWVAARTL